MIRSINSKSLGNLTDAFVADWALTIKKILKKYDGIKTVIPGHGDIGGTELLNHTITLVEKEQNK